MSASIMHHQVRSGSADQRNYHDRITIKREASLLKGYLATKIHGPDTIELFFAIRFRNPQPAPIPTPV